jgi:hypothetical protein
MVEQSATIATSNANETGLSVSPDLTGLRALVIRTDLCSMFGEPARISQMGSMLSWRGADVVETIVSPLQVFNPSKLRGLMLVESSRVVQVPAVGIAYDVVFNLEEPEAIDAGVLGSAFPGAIIAVPTRAAIAGSAAMWRALEAESGVLWNSARQVSTPTTAQTKILLHGRKENAFASLSIRMAPRFFRSSEGGPIEVLAIEDPTPLDHPITVVRVFVCLDIRMGTVHVLPRTQMRTIPILPCDLDTCQTGALLERALAELKGASRISMNCDTTLSAELKTVAEDVGDVLLGLPSLTGADVSPRLLPLAAIELLSGNTIIGVRPTVLSVRWTTPVALDVDEAHSNLDTWLALVMKRCPRISAPLVEVASDFAEMNGIISANSSAFAEGSISPQTVHPLCAILPRLYGETGLVATRPIDGATFDSIHEDLVGPSDTKDLAMLANYLGRITDLDTSPSNGTARYVEPGVGRTYLVDKVRIASRPELHDFAITGAGLTPYSVRGFADVGNPITGLAAMVRLHHRRRCAQRLESVGARTSPLVAVLKFPGTMAPLPDGSKTAAGVAVRAFRCVLRVRQLDPVAVFYQSLQHAPLVGPAVLEMAHLHGIEYASERAAILRMLDSYAGGFNDIRRVVWPRPLTNEIDAEAVAIRRWAISRHAPYVLALVQKRVALELGRDPNLDPVEGPEYISWFASTLGRQLALWHRHRFLHDYHKPGISRYNGIVTLVESNVTLLGEFPDLDTAIFVDDDADAEALQLLKRDCEILRECFDDFHCRELEAARCVVKSLTCFATGGDSDMSRWADAMMLESYELGRRAP